MFIVRVFFTRTSSDVAVFRGQGEPVVLLVTAELCALLTAGELLLEK